MQTATMPSFARNSYISISGCNSPSLFLVIKIFCAFNFCHVTQPMKLFVMANIPYLQYSAYEYMYACMYVCNTMYAYKYVGMYICMHICIYVCMVQLNLNLTKHMRHVINTTRFSFHSHIHICVHARLMM